MCTGTMQFGTLYSGTVRSTKYKAVTAGNGIVDTVTQRDLAIA